MNIPNEFSFKLSKELQEECFDYNLYFAKKLNDNEYEITWEDDEVVNSTRYPNDEVEEYLQDKLWIMQED